MSCTKLQRHNIKVKDFTRYKIWSMFKFHIEDPLITVTEQVRIGDMLNFLLQIKFKEHTFFLFKRPDKQLTEGEKLNLLREAHGNVATGHFGENKTIKRLREQTSWKNMEKDAIGFVKKCKVCQQEKLTRIRPKVEAVIPEMPTQPNDKIAMDIVGPLPETMSGNKYILSIQDVLTKYIILVALRETTSESILTNLLDHYRNIHFRSFSYCFNGLM